MRRVAACRPMKAKNAAARTPSSPTELSLAADHQLPRMKPSCRRAKCSWAAPSRHTCACSGVSVCRNKKRVKMPLRAFCTRPISWRERSSMRPAFLMAPSICAAMPLRRWRSLATSSASGGSFSFGGSPSFLICERTSSRCGRSASAASLAPISIFSMPLRRVERSRWEPGDCSRFFSAASSDVDNALTGLTSSSTPGPVAAGAAGVGSGAAAGGGALGEGGVPLLGAVDPFLVAAGASGVAGVCASAGPPDSRATPHTASARSLVMGSDRRIRNLPAGGGVWRNVVTRPLRRDDAAGALAIEKRSATALRRALRLCRFR